MPCRIAQAAFAALALAAALPARAQAPIAPRSAVGAVEEPDVVLRPPSPTPRLGMQDGLPTLELFGGRFTLQPQARFDLDMGGFRAQPLYQDGKPPKYLDDTRPGIPSDGLNVRRARVGLQGRLLGDFTYAFTWQFEQAPGTVFAPATLSRLFELQLAYDGWAWVTPRIGAYTLMQTIPYAMSSFERTFLEPPSIITVATSLASGDSRVALGGEARGDRWFASAYLAQGSTATLNDGRNRGLVGRATGMAVDLPGFSLSLGVNAAAQLAPGFKGNPNQITLRDYPELRLDPTRLLDTGTLQAGQGWAVGPELQALLGPVYVQSEAQIVRVDATGGGTRRFRGYYVDVSLPLVGPPRRYDRLRGIFTRPEVPALDPRAGSWGWIELAVRWSWLSLNDAPVAGGSQGIFGLALNWYPASRLRWTLQYQLGDVRLLPGTSNSPTGADRAFQSIGARIAFDW